MATPKPVIPRTNSRDVASPSRFILLVVTAVAAALGPALTEAFSFAGSARGLRSPAEQRCSEAIGSGRRCRAPEPVLFAAPTMKFGVTSLVIETVAKGILNLALANPRQATVECRINSSAMGLVRGNLEQAQVDG